MGSCHSFHGCSSGFWLQQTPCPGFLSSLDTSALPAALGQLPCSQLPSIRCPALGWSCRGAGWSFLWAESSWQQRKEPAHFPKLISVSKCGHEEGGRGWDVTSAQMEMHKNSCLAPIKVRPTPSQEVCVFRDPHFGIHARILASE